LLFGPYSAPSCKRGDEAISLNRDGPVVITAWTDAPISWPRCRQIGQRGGSGLLVTEELVRAIRSEASAAIQYWWGINSETVWRWRKLFGVTQWGTPGSKRLQLRSSQAGAKKLRGSVVPKHVIRKRIRTRQMNGPVPMNRWKETGWTAEQVALLDQFDDKEIALLTTISPGMPTIQSRSS
jgi:hypothetical protein